MHPDLGPIFQAIESQDCLPFLGAGASAGYQHQGQEIPGIPLGGQLAKALAASCGLTNGFSSDLSYVAEYFIFTNNGHRANLDLELQKHITPVNRPRPIQTALAAIKNINFLITSNYDQLLETAVMRAGRPYTRHVHEPLNPKTAHFRCKLRGVSPSIVLHKMHGTIEQPNTMVVTQSDYIRYLANLNDADRGMPEVFRKFLIPQHTLLFLGYSLADWNFRVIWEGVLATYRENGVDIQSFAVVRSPSDFERQFWAQRNIRLVNMDLTELAIALADHFDVEIPEIGHKPARPGDAGS